MKKQELMDAINQTAEDLGLEHWIEVKDEIFIPSAMNNIASLCWYTKFKDGENTKLIREQGVNLIIKGGLIFDD